MRVALNRASFAGSPCASQDAEASLHQLRSDCTMLRQQAAAARAEGEELQLLRQRCQQAEADAGLKAQAR